MLKSIEELRSKRFKNKWSAFVSWLWIKRSVDTHFPPGVLLEENRKKDDSLPSPALSLSDAVNLFFIMEKKGLVFELEQKHCYILNKVEEEKWDEFISDLERWKWTRHWVVKHLVSIASFIIAAIVGGFMGGFARPVGEFVVRLFIR